MRIALVDDEKSVTDQLTEQIARYAMERGMPLETQVYHSGDVFLEAYHNQFDIVCLDIEMEGTDGMTAAAKLREKDQTVVLLFITNMAQYAVRGYEVRALDYLIKPVSYETLCYKLQGAIAQVQRQAKNVILLRSGGDSYGVDTREVLYFESRRHNLLCHTQRQTLSLRNTMKNAQAQVAGLPFAKCNHCYLVNLSYVAAIEGYELILTNGQRLEVSRSRKTSFLSAYARYLGGLNHGL